MTVSFDLLKRKKFVFDLLDTPDIEAIATPEGRKYPMADGRKFESVTTFLGRVTDKSGLDNWREFVGDERADKILQQAGIRGSNSHNNIEAFLKGEDQIPGPYFTMFRKFKNILQLRVGTIRCMEGVLFSGVLRLAGRVDMVCMWNGRLAVVDFKTALKPKKKENIKHYFLQATIYAMMLKEMFGLIVDDIVILIANELNSDIQEFVEPAFKLESKVIKLREANNE